MTRNTNRKPNKFWTQDSSSERKRKGFYTREEGRRRRQVCWCGSGPGAVLRAVLLCRWRRGRERDLGSLYNELTESSALRRKAVGVPGPASVGLQTCRRSVGEGVLNRWVVLPILDRNETTETSNASLTIKTTQSAPGPPWLQSLDREGRSMEPVLLDSGWLV